MARRASLIARRTKQVRVTRSETYLVNLKYLGDEPTFKKGFTDSEYARAFNWYNSMCSIGEARQYLETYLTESGREKEARKLKSVPDTWIPTTAAWIARMLSRGVTVRDSSKAFLEEHIKIAFKHSTDPKDTDKPAAVKVSIQDRVKEKTSDIIGEIEGLIDSGEEFSLYDWLKSNEIPAIYAPHIVAYYTPWLAEILEALEGSDEQLKEGYRRYTKKQLEARATFFNTLLEDAERYGSNTKKTRTARKPRTISVEKKLKSLKYQKEDSNFKIASVSPEKIIGCQELWMFNTKYKTLTVLRAIDRGGIQVKGTSFTGYDEKNSFTKRTGRKPEQYVDKVLNGGKIILRKLMEEIKGEAPLAYRSNENTILLRVI